MVLGVVGESEEDVEEELAGQLADARLLGHLQIKIEGYPSFL